MILVKFINYCSFYFNIIRANDTMRRKLTAEKLLRDEKAKQILACFLLNWNKKLRYSEIEKKAGIKSRSTFHDKLKQLQREGIIAEEYSEGQKQYQLSTAFQNIVFHNYLMDLLQEMSKYPMYFHSVFTQNFIFYGIVPELLDEKDKLILTIAATDLNNFMKEIKKKQIEKIFKTKIEEIVSSQYFTSLPNKKKSFLIKNLTPATRFASFLYLNEENKFSSINDIKPLVRKFYLPLEKEWQIEIICRIVLWFVNEFKKIYPLRVGFCGYNSFVDIGGLKWCVYNDEEKRDKDSLEMYITSEMQDYIHYMKRELEITRYELYKAKNTGKDVSKILKNLNRWEKENDEIEKKLNKDQKIEYSKKVVEDLMDVSLLILPSILLIADAKILKSPPSLKNYQDFMRYLGDSNAYDYLDECRYWVKRYKKITGYSNAAILNMLSLKHEILMSLISHREINETIKSLLYEYTRETVRAFEGDKKIRDFLLKKLREAVEKEEEEDEEKTKKYNELSQQFGEIATAYRDLKNKIGDFLRHYC